MFCPLEIGSSDKKTEAIVSGKIAQRESKNNRL